MSRGSFNPAELLRQLGLKSARDLPVLETVQPVLPVGDASGLSPSLIAPIAWAGGEVAAVAGQYGAFQVSGRGSGGSWVRQFTTAAPGASGTWRLNVGTTDPLAGGIATALPLLDMAANPVQSVVRKGASATLLPVATTPTWNQIAATTFTMIDPVYLLPGSILTIQQATVNALFLLLGHRPGCSRRAAIPDGIMPGYIDPGIGTLPAQRSSRRFFQLWRTSGSLRSIWNTIVPVAVVQRYRSEDEGSHRALTVESWGTANEFSAVYVGTDITSGGENYIIEIDALNSHRLCPAAVSPFPVDLHLFTPLNPYNPVSTLSPFGIYTPGLFLDPSFTEGTFIGFGGSNPSLPSYVGLTLEKFDSVMSAARWYANHTETLLTFDPPLRIYPGSGICLQMRSKVVTQPIYLNATFLYREIFTTSGIEPT